MQRLTAHDLALGTIQNYHRPGGKTSPGENCLLAIPGESRDKHMYVAGSTGSGKSKFLESLIRQDIRNHRHTGSAIILLDPHGSLYDNVMNWAARSGLSRPILPIDLRRDDWVVAYNAIRHREVSSPSVVIDAFVRTMVHAWGASGTDQTPLLARWITNLLEVLYQWKLTLPQALYLLNDSEVRSHLTAKLRDEWAQRDWEMAKGMNAKEFEQQVSSTVNRLRRFVGADQLRLMLGQPDVSLDLRRALDEGWIILVSLATENGKVSPQNAELFGSMLLTDLWTAARERGKRKGLRPCRIYVDEFQSFVSPVIAENLDQSRGFGLSWTMAHQFPLQLLDRGDHGKQLWHSIMENANSKVVFSMSHEENLRPLAQWLFTGVFDADEIKHIMTTTKVMDYREEERESRTESHSEGRGGGRTTGSQSSRAKGRNVARDEIEDDEAGSESQSESYSDSESDSESWQQQSGWSTSTGTVLIPVFGREVSHIQFRSLDEQLSRAMAVLFGQPTRQAVVRLVGMRAPVTIRTSFIPFQRVTRGRIDAYADSLYVRWNFCLPRQTAIQAIEARDRQFMQQFAIDQTVAEEPQFDLQKLKRGNRRTTPPAP